MKSKSTRFLILIFSLSVVSLLISSEAHPLNKDSSELTDSIGFSSNELPKDEIVQTDKEPVTRNKRTVGFLRQLFPGISQIIDRKIQQITRILFRVVGRLILRGGGGNGGGGGGGGGDGGRKISITLPTYPPIEDEEEETNAPSTDSSSSSSSSSTSTSETPPDIDLRISGSENDATRANITSNNSGTSSPSNTEVPSRSESGSTNSPESNTIIRKSRDVSDVLSDTTLSADLLDLDLLSSTESSTTKRAGLLWRLGRDMRSKRGSLLSSSGGSGNFIFDLVRLIAGSGTTPEKDEEQNAPRDTRDDDTGEVNDVSDSNGTTSSNYNPEDDTSGIPGPLTRFALLVNRGISNVFKDLILRIAQTSERIVNFKARLLTAII